MKQQPDELSELLHKWEAPPWDKALDQRILTQVMSRPANRWRLWAALAACLAVASALVAWRNSNPESGTLPRFAASDFRPLEDGEIRVLRPNKKGEIN